MDGEKIQSVATGSLMNRCREGNDVACVLAALVKNRWWFFGFDGFFALFPNLPLFFLGKYFDKEREASHLPP